MEFKNIALLLVLGCTATNDRPAVDDSATTDDTSTSGWVEVPVTVHMAIDGASVDPVPVCLHEVDEDTGDETVLATAVETGVPISVLVPPAGVTARPWVGPATADTTSDGHRVLEWDGRRYVHPKIDLPVDADGECDETLVGNLEDKPGCEVTAVGNALVDGLYHCVYTQTWYDPDAADFKGSLIDGDEGDFDLETSEGENLFDPMGAGLGGFLIAGSCETESMGSGFIQNCGDADVWTNSSYWDENGDWGLDVVNNETFVDSLACTYLGE